MLICGFDVHYFTRLLNELSLAIEWIFCCQLSWIFRWNWFSIWVPIRVYITNFFFTWTFLNLHIKSFWIISFFVVNVTSKRAPFPNEPCDFSFGIKLQVPLHKWRCQKRVNFAVLNYTEKCLKASSFRVRNNLLTSTRCFSCICNSLTLLCNCYWNSWACLSPFLLHRLNDNLEKNCFFLLNYQKRFERQSK